MIYLLGFMLYANKIVTNLEKINSVDFYIWYCPLCAAIVVMLIYIVFVAVKVYKISFKKVEFHSIESIQLELSRARKIIWIPVSLTLGYIPVLISIFIT